MNGYDVTIEARIVHTICVSADSEEEAEDEVSRLTGKDIMPDIDKVTNVEIVQIERSSRANVTARA